MNFSPNTVKLIQSTVALGTDFLRFEPDTPFICWHLRALGVAKDNWGVQRRVEFANLLGRLAAPSHGK